MLTELLQLKRNLELQKVSTEIVHRDFDVPGLSSYTTFKVVIRSDGVISQLDLPPLDEKLEYWTLKKGKHRFFPAIRMSIAPIVLAPEDPKWQALKKPSIDVLRVLIDESKDRLSEVDLLTKCRSQIERILSWDKGGNDTLLHTLSSFVKAFQMLAVDPQRTSNELVAAVLHRLNQPVSEDLLEKLTSLLVGSRKESQTAEASVEYKVQLLLDFEVPNDLGFSLYHPRVRKLVLKYLVASDIQIEDKQTDVCAMTGTRQSPLNGPFASWSVPPIISKPVAPFSKFSAAKCNLRYRRADHSGFPIGASTARELVASLKRITSPEFAGKTWSPIHNGRIEQKNKKKIEAQDILIAYPSFDAQTLATVDIFIRPNSAASSNPTASHAAAKRFGERAEPVLQAMKQRISASSIPEYLTLLSIRQISEGQIQLTYSARHHLSEFVSAIEAWQASENNLPQGIRFPLPVGRDGKGFRLFSPRLLFPEEISFLLSRQWIRDGTECTLLDGPPIGVVLDLFLRKADVWQECAERMLEMTLTRSTTLLVHAGNVLHRDHPPDWTLWSGFVAKSNAGAQDKRKPDPRYDVASTISLIGSLLHALNSTRTRYMKESAFLVGKLLAMADELHRCYCVAVRGGDIPPALIGNGLVGRASESPASALAELLDRSRIYVGWAKTASISEKMSKSERIAIFSARKVLRNLQPLAEALHSADGLEAEMNTSGKAQLLLGYLSSVRDRPEESHDQSLKEAETVNSKSEPGESP